MAHHVFLVPSVLIFYSHTVLLHFKSLYVCALRQGPASPDLVKFRWNDRAREGGVRILYVYRFRWFSLFMFFKHSAAKPLQESLSVFSLHVLRTMIHLFMNKTETTTCICMWAIEEADIFTLSPGTRVYFGLRKTWINSVIWMLFITSQHIFFCFPNTPLRSFVKDFVSLVLWWQNGRLRQSALCSAHSSAAAAWCGRQASL